MVTESRKGGMMSDSGLFSFILLIIMAVILVLLIVFIRTFSKYYKAKTSLEKDAINKGFLAYMVTNSAIIGWLVYNRTNPKNRYK